MDFTAEDPRCISRRKTYGNPPKKLRKTYVNPPSGHHFASTASAVRAGGESGFLCCKLTGG